MTATSTDLARASMARLTEPGGALDRDSGRATMMIAVLRLLADGRPVPRPAAEAALAATGVDGRRIAGFLDSWTQRDPDGAIVGLGLTQRPTVHRITLDAAPQLWAWCALDTLLFTRLLGRPSSVASTPPGTSGTVTLRLDPNCIRTADPAEAVITIPIRTNDEVDVSSTEAIWRTYCHHSFFFASRADAQAWAAARDDIAVITVAEGFDIAGAMADAVLRNATTTTSKDPDTATAADQRLQEAVRGHAFRRLLRERTPATTTWLAAQLAHPEPEIAATITDMASRGRLRLDGHSEITGAAGLSITPDRHQIDLPQGRFWTWCHYDFLGIFGALAADGQATITDPAPLTLRFQHGRPDATDLVLLLPDRDTIEEDCCGDTYAQWCPHANLFPDEATADSWAQQHGIQARIIPITEAVDIAASAWKPLI